MSRGTPSRLSRLEKGVLIQSGVSLMAATWLYGGNIGWVRLGLSVWMSLSVVVTVAAFLQPGPRGAEARSKAWWLAPLALFSGLVVLSLVNPSFRAVTIDGETAYVRSTAAHAGWPSTVAPELTFKAWWFGTGAYLSAFNLAVVLQSRSALRWLLVLIAGNTLALSVLGTVQKLSGSGFYFGASESPNLRFFATFIYYNHWGAFMILCLTTAVGLLFYHTRRYQGRDLWHSPFGLALVGVLLIATSAPVSASRASTVMAAFVLLVALVHALVNITSARRARQLSIWPPLLLIVMLASVTTGAVGWLSYRSLSERYTETRRVIDADQSVFGARAELYRDTWSLAKEQPVFGWGLDTFAVSFQLRRPYTVDLGDRTKNFYANAHSDWLQSLADTGCVGTALLILMGILPLTALPRALLGHPLVAYPLFGCTLALMYAWVEFPFSSGAFVITFWILLFGTIRFAQLTELASHNPHE